MNVPDIRNKNVKPKPNNRPYRIASEMMRSIFFPFLQAAASETDGSRRTDREFVSTHGKKMTDMTMPDSTP